MDKINIFWFRRDLRLIDNTALYHALKQGNPVLLLFIFDSEILNKIENKADARVSFIYHALQEIDIELSKYHTSVLIEYGSPKDIWRKLIKNYKIENVYFNHDYEPYATERDLLIKQLLTIQQIPVFTYKDQVVFEKKEIQKADGTPYTVFTPYFKKWLEKLTEGKQPHFNSESKLSNLFKKDKSPFSLKDIGFTEVETTYNKTVKLENILPEYEKYRDFPSLDKTTRTGVLLRFGTVSIRTILNIAIEKGANKFISELAWRDFYMMILWEFPHISNNSFKPAYDQIEWRNNETEFKAWCSGKTGYPLVDAGMRQLNKTGWMHNRVRMVVASFLTKHLLIDWRWGEAYFKEKLLDYEMASNVGGWQWACGSGNDAAPYFRIFSPDAQTKRFDSKLAYCKKWIPELETHLYIRPIVEHSFARERALNAFKKALINH